MAATSVGMVGGAALLDLCYEEDSQAEVDMNVVMTADGGLIETQATAEKGSFFPCAAERSASIWPRRVCKQIFAVQRAVLGL